MSNKSVEDGFQDCIVDIDHKSGYVRTKDQSSGSGSILSGLEYDDIELTATTNTTDTYTLRKDASDIATLLVTFTNSSKSKVSRAQRTDL